MNVIDRHPGKRILITFGAAEEIDMTPCRTEVEDLHRFFEEWMSGRLPADDSAFVRLERSLAEEFQMITPDGRPIERGPLVSQLRGAHGIHADDPSFRIWIEECRSREVAEGVHVVSYKEWQTIKERTRGRISSAVFRQSDEAPNGWKWLRLQETWISGD